MVKNAGEGMHKPTIHVSNDDAENARAVGMGDKSPSTVYSEALENWAEYEEVKEKVRQLKEKYPDIELGELLTLMEDIEVDQKS